MTILGKIGRHPNRTPAGKVFSFLLPRDHDANQPARGIFQTFSISPVLFTVSHHATTRAWSDEHDVQRIQAPGARNHEQSRNGVRLRPAHG
jgi:hypothetical protein